MKYDVILADKFLDMMLNNNGELSVLAQKMSEYALMYFDTSEIGLLVEKK